MVSVLGTDPYLGVDARGRALSHPGHRASFRTGLSGAPNSPHALVTACGRTDRRIRRGRPGLPSGRSLDACTETGAAEQPEAAARARSPNHLQSHERRRRASPHARRAEMFGISRPNRHRNPATYRIEAGPSASSADSRSPARSGPSACAPQISSRTEGGGPVIVPEWGSDGGMSMDGPPVGRTKSRPHARQNLARARPCALRRADMPPTNPASAACILPEKSEPSEKSTVR